MQYHSIVSEERRVAARHRFAGIRLFFLRAGFSRLARAGFSSQARERATEATREKEKLAMMKNFENTRANTTGAHENGKLEDRGKGASGKK